MTLRFEWDRRKAGANLEKQRVSFGEGTTVFADPPFATIVTRMRRDLLPWVCRRRRDFWSSSTRAVVP